MMTTETPRVWVGCLACYNGGDLVGQWLDADEAGDITTEQLHRDAHAVRLMRDVSPHEELWVMDHEGFGGVLKGECSPMEAQRIAEVIAGLDLPVAAYAGWLEWSGASVTDDSAQQASDAYRGTYESEEDYAREYASETVTDWEDAAWPHNHIDWESATRELFADLFSVEDGHSTVYVFDAH